VLLSGTGVLLRGPSGCGKSDLALRLIDGGARLVADDQVLVSPGPAAPAASAPPTLHGLLEVRGLGILRFAAADEAPLGLLVDLVGPERVERLPEIEEEDVLGVPVRRIALAPFHASAAAKVRLAAERIGAGTLLPVPP